MKAIVIGGAGFIGSHLVDALLARGDEVTAYDNLSVGCVHWVHRKAKLIKGDALDTGLLTRSMLGHDIVFHLAANPEARAGLDDRRLDLTQGTVATAGALEASYRAGVRKFVFASSGTVYGETSRPCGEYEIGLPISLYGASKLAGEALVSAYSECFGMHGIILRFGNVVGSRATHGCIFDFLRRLKENPTHLKVLGDGTQRKPYLHVSDCVAGMLFVSSMATTVYPDVFNLTPEGSTSVANIAQWCANGARVEYAGGVRGWPGDVAHSAMSGARLARNGWTVRHTSDQAAEIAVREVRRQVMG